MSFVRTPDLDLQPAWYCVRSRPKQEHIAAAQLSERLGIEVICPRVRYRKATQRGPVWFVEALFPGYLFARFALIENQRNVEFAQGVLGLVRFGARPPALDMGTVAALSQIDFGAKTVHTLAPKLEAGDAVHISSGAFSGTAATVKELLPAKERVRVLIDFLGRMTEIEVPSSTLIASMDSPSLIGALFTSKTAD